MNNSLSYIAFGVLTAVVTAYVLWPAPDKSSSIAATTLPENELAQPIVAGPDETIVCAFQPWSGSTVEVAGTSFKVGSGAAFAAFKVPVSSIRLADDPKRENGRECQTSHLDYSFVSKTLNKKKQDTLLIVKINAPTESTTNQTNTEILTSISTIKYKQYDSGKISAENLNNDCKNEIIPNSKIVILDNKSCIPNLYQFAGYSKPDKNFSNYTYFYCYLNKNECNLNFTTPNVVIRTHFDKRAFEDWKKIRSAVLDWLDEHLVYEFSDQK